MEAQADGLPTGTGKSAKEHVRLWYRAARCPMEPLVVWMAVWSSRVAFPFPILAGDCSAADWMEACAIRVLGDPRPRPFQFRISKSSGTHDIS